jgi:hypothetical protein
MNYAEALEGTIDLVIIFAFLILMDRRLPHRADDGKRVQPQGRIDIDRHGDLDPLFVVMEALFMGTVGKFLLALRVVKADGLPIAGRESIVRNVLRIVDGFAFCYRFYFGLRIGIAAAGRRRGGRYLRVSGS